MFPEGLALGLVFLDKVVEQIINSASVEMPFRRFAFFLERQLNISRSQGCLSSSRHILHHFIV